MATKPSPSDLKKIPHIGPKLEAKLNRLGIHSQSDLAGKCPEQLYKKLLTIYPGACRCVLYTFRNATYFVNNEKHDPKKLLWWNWK